MRAGDGKEGSKLAALHPGDPDPGQACALPRPFLPFPPRPFSRAAMRLVRFPPRAMITSGLAHGPSIRRRTAWTTPGWRRCIQLGKVGSSIDRIREGHRHRLSTTVGVRRYRGGNGRSSRRVRFGSIVSSAPSVSSAAICLKASTGFPITSGPARLRALRRAMRRSARPGGCPHARGKDNQRGFHQCCDPCQFG